MFRCLSATGASEQKELPLEFASLHAEKSKLVKNYAFRTDRRMLHGRAQLRFQSRHARSQQTAPRGIQAVVGESAFVPAPIVVGLCPSTRQCEAAVTTFFLVKKKSELPQSLRQQLPWRVRRTFFGHGLRFRSRKGAANGCTESIRAFR